MDLSIIAENIYKRRKKLDMSQAELAEKMGLGKNGQRSISAWESGQLPKLENIIKLADALRCDPEHLLGFDAHPHVTTPWIAEQIQFEEDVIEALIDLKCECDECGEDDPISHESHMKALLLNTIVEYILTPVENPLLGQPTPDELLNLSRNYLENFETIKQEGGSYARKRSKKWSDANQAMNGIEFTIGYRLGRIVGSGLKKWFSKNY